MTSTLMPSRESLRKVTEKYIGTGGARKAEARTPPPPPSREMVLVTTALTLLAVLLLTFVLEVSAVGAVRHARAQRVEYKGFRADLAAATAPTGQFDAQGKLVALGRPIALIKIGSIGVSEVVGEGTTAAVLQNGPGHLRASVLPGQPGTSIIMGRQAGYGGPFRKIASLKTGATITVVTGLGTSTYAVSGIRHAGDKGQVSTDPTIGTLTLITAAGTPFAPNGAVYVDARLTSKAFASAGLTYGTKALGPNETAMSSDRSHALQLFLWAQLLLLLGLAVAWLRTRWGRPQVLLIGVPLLALAALQVSHYTAQLLPNLF